jgi:ribosomal protein S18 acetylase RimI-like enzyme
MTGPATEGGELDFSAPSEEIGSLAHDRFPVRSLQPDDLPAILRIDRHITGRDRRAYYVRKLDEAMRESAVRVSLVAEIDGEVAGFIMARVDFGAFGATEPEAVLDTIAVDPGCVRRGVASALLSQLLTNLGGLLVERVRTKVAWNQADLIGLLDRHGFRPGNRLALRRQLG